MATRPTTPRAGSRVHTLAHLAPGQSLWFEAKPGQANRLAQQLGVDARRAGWPAPVRTMQALAIHPETREVFELVRISRAVEV